MKKKGTKNNNNKAVGVTPGKNNLQLSTWSQCYLMSLISLNISTDLNLLLCILLFPLEIGRLCGCNTINYFSVPRNVYIFYEFLLKRAGLRILVYVYCLEVLLMPSSYSYTLLILI